MKYKNFIFEKYQLDKSKNEIKFYYSLDGRINFVEKLKLDLKPDWADVNLDLVESVLFNLHLISGINYWKTYCPQSLTIKSGSLTFKQANFWNKLYTKGLGEFFYKNKIDWRGLVNFPVSRQAKTNKLKHKLSNRSLVAFGGGKDSIVSAELLKKHKRDFTLYTLGDSRVQSAAAKVLGRKRIILERKE